MPHTTARRLATVLLFAIATTALVACESNNTHATRNNPDTATSPPTSPNGPSGAASGSMTGPAGTSGTATGMPGAGAASGSIGTGTTGGAPAPR